jgi:hypothetical protein
VDGGSISTGSFPNIETCEGKSSAGFCFSSNNGCNVKAAAGAKGVGRTST